MAIRKISEFVAGVPTSEDKILYEHNESGKSATIRDVGRALGLSTVATSGDFGDLINKPPYIGNTVYTADLDHLTTSGFYRIEQDQPNSPGNWGQLLVVHGGGDTISQLYFSVYGAVFARFGNPPQVGGTGSWSGWHRLWKEGDAVTGAVFN